MKYIYQTLAIALLVSLGFSSCENRIPHFGPTDENISATNITDVSADTSVPGQIKLVWNHDATATTSNLQYVKVEYFDPYINKSVSMFASAAADTFLMEKTFVAGSPYEVKLTPVSTSLNEGTPVSISVASTALPLITTAIVDEIKLTEDMLGTNAQEPSEGPIAGAIDRNTSTFFHSAWSVGVNGRHNFQIDLKEERSKIRIAAQPRSNNMPQLPKDIKLFTSSNGSDWEELQGEYQFPEPKNADHKYYIFRVDGPEETDTYKKQDLILPAGTRFIKFENIRSHRNQNFFSLSEIHAESVKYDILDREADAKKVIDSYSN